jgi:hypothetical protein
MSTTPVAEPTTPAQPEPQTPYDFLALFPGAPTQSQIDTFRSMVPGARLRLLPMPDGKRLFLLRGFTALELLGAQSEAVKLSPEKQLPFLQTKMAAHCTLWCSIVPSGKLTEMDLASAGAGLAGTLYSAVADLSDFMEPQVLDQLYIDL